MSGLVTPPPRPPRPYLPAQKAKDGTKLGIKNRPSSGVVTNQLSKPELLRRSHTFSDGNDCPPRPLRPDIKQDVRSQSSSEREISSPERQVSPDSSKAEEQQMQDLFRIASKNDPEMRRWSYGFEIEANPQSSYRPRPPPPRPTSRQLSSPESQQDPEDDLKIRRRSYTSGSVKSLPSYPIHGTRQSTRSFSERETSTSPERRMSPIPSNSVNLMGTLIEKSYSTGASLNKSAPLRPSRPPPPRAKTLPKATSLTSYKNQRDKVSQQRRQHSKSTAESNTVARSFSPQQDLPMPSAKQTHTELDVTKNGHLLITDTSRQPDGISAASSEAPIIPPRPFRPPRPFPPGKGGKLSSGRVKGTQKKHMKSSNTQLEENHVQGDEHEPITTSPTEVQSVEPSISNIGCVLENEPPVTEDLVPSSKQNVLPIENIEQPSSESMSAQEQLKAHNVEEATAVQPQPSSLVSGVDKLEEEDDMISPLPESNFPRSRGSKFITTMKKRFGSLRSPNRKRIEASARSGRSSSDSNLPVYNETGKYPDPLPQGIIHPIVIKCVAYLNKESVLKEEGLFRIPGDVAVIKQLRERFIAGSDVDLTEIVDPHTVAGLLKLHFREQRVSMIPRGQPLTTITQAVRDKDVETVREVINSMDATHTAMLRLVAELLTMIASFSEYNKMSSGTLSTSCAPSMFPYLPTGSAVIVMKFLIDHCADIFQQ